MKKQINHKILERLIELLQELRKIDLLSKSTTLKDIALLHPIINKICNEKKYA